MLFFRLFIAFDRIFVANFIVTCFFAIGIVIIFFIIVVFTLRFFGFLIRDFWVLYRFLLWIFVRLFFGLL
jgi:hypothetical protein